MLSHEVSTCLTEDFFKETPSSNIVECLEQLKACIFEIGHPMLLPLIMFSHSSDFKTDIRQREAREWLRKLEHTISMEAEVDETRGYVDDEVIDLDAINRDLVECHTQVLWARPVSYIRILESIKETTEMFNEKLTPDRKDSAIQDLQSRIITG